MNVFPFLFVMTVIVGRGYLIRRFLPSLERYKPSRLIELGIFIAVPGVLIPAALAELSIVSYDSEIVTMLIAVIVVGGFLVSLIGIGKEIGRTL